MVSLCQSEFWLNSYPGLELIADLYWQSRAKKYRNRSEGQISVKNWLILNQYKHLVLEKLC